MKKIPGLWIVVVTSALIILGVAAMFTSGGPSDRRAVTPGDMYGQNYLYRQQVALQAYSGPSCAPGSLQVPEIGAEVLPAGSGGLLVTRVYKMSHADRNGLLVGDIIIKFAGKKITSPDMFFRAIPSARPESYVKFAVLRSGRSKTLSIMMGKRELDGVIVPPDAAPAHPYAIP